MIEFTAWLSQNAANLLIQSTVLIGVGLLAAHLLRKQGSAVQSAIYRATLIVVLACPLATILLDQLGFDGWSIQLPDTTRTVLVAEIPPTSPVPFSIEPFPVDSSFDVSNIPISSPSDEYRLEPESTAMVPTPTTSSNISKSTDLIESQLVAEPIMVEQILPNTTWVVAYATIGLVWLTGVTLFFVRLIWAYRKLNMMRRESSPASDSEQILCGQLASSIHVRTPDVRRNSLLFSPCLTGITSPTILLPVEIKDQVPLEKAFAHELAHLRRHDTLWNLIQRIALSLFFYQPLLWRLVYRLETTAEEVCDDYVVRHCKDRAGYAQQLVDLAESNLLAPNMAGLGMFNSKSILGHRIVRILDSTRTLTTQISFPMVACIASLAIVCATLGGFLGNGRTADSIFAATDEAVGELPEAVPDPNSDGVHSVLIRGQLTDENGAPIVDGDVAVIAHKKFQFKTFESGPTGSILAESKTGSNGSFEIKLDDVDAASYREAFIIANAETRALTWKQLDLSAKEPFESIVLPPEELIRGQFLDLDGRPAANVAFRIGAIIQRTHSSDSWTNIKSIQPDIDKFPKAWLSPGQSDHQGHFQIHSISANHGVSFHVDGDDRFSPQNIMLCTGFPETRGERDGTYRSLVKNPAPGEVAKLTLNASQIFEGTVTYADTGEPAVFAKVTIWAAQQEMGSMVSVVGHADKDGKFKLNPRPGVRFGLTAYPASGIPYLAKSSEEIAWDAGDFRRTVDIKLPPGVLVKGAVVDSETNKPIAGATVQYGVEITNTNPIDQAASGWQNLQLTDEKGEFEITVVPGPGRLFVKAEGNYAQKTVGSNEFNLFLGPRGEGRQFVNAIVELDPESSESTLQLPPIKIEPDYRISGSFVDSENKPVESVKLVSDLETYAKRVYWVLRDEPISGSEFDLRGLSPDKDYTVSAINQQRQIGATFTLRVGDKPTVKLLDCGVATARLVDSDGTPLAGIRPVLMLVVTQGKTIGTDSDTSKVKLPPDSTYAANIGRPNRSRFLVTDAEGRITWSPLIPEATYQILYEIDGKIVSLKEFQVKPGEKLDLGTIDATKLDSEPMSDLNSDEVKSNSDALQGTGASEHEEQKSTNTIKDVVDDSNNDGQTVATNHVIQGVVTDQDGNPVSGASVRFNSWTFQPDYESTVSAETVSDAAGHFVLKIDEQELAQSGFPDNKNVFAGLIVQADGYGSVQTNWADYRDNEPLTILLPAENRLAGRVVDLEGNPVVGAKVHFTYAMQLGEQVADRFLDNLQQTGKFATARDIFREQQNMGINGFNDAIDPLAETNQLGEFEFRGIPRDSMVNLRVEHPQIVTQLVAALSRPMETVDADPQYKVFGDHPLIVTQPCRPIVGKVVDSKTGEPIAGATVLCTEMGIRETVFWSSPAPRTLTDDKGQFELLGVPKAEATKLMVYPPNELPYLIKEVRDLPDTVGLEPAEMAIELHQGIWITGQVTDCQTGEGVRGEIVYLPMKDNPYLDGVSGYQTGNSLDDYNTLQHFDTDDRGHFRIAGLPGRAVLGARVDSQDYRPANGYENVLNEFGSEYSQEQIEHSLEIGNDLRGKKFLDIRMWSFVWRNTHGSSFIGIDPPAGTDEVIQNIQMDPGHELTIQVIAADGKPVERFEVSRFDGFYGKREFTDGTCTLTRVGDDEKRWISIRGINQPIGAIVEINGAHRNPSLPSEYQTVILELYGTIRGRLIDKDSKPLANYSVTATYGVETTTNERGEFEIGEMFAGQKFNLNINAPGKPEFYMFVPNKELEPGQTLELDPINVDDLGGVMISGMAG